MDRIIARRIDYAAIRSTIITLFLSCLLFEAFGQTATLVTFKQTSFMSDGKIFKTEEKQIQVDSMLGLEFYRTNFYMPYYFLVQFINKKFKSQTVEIWRDPKKINDFGENWKYTYVYDALSRVTDYDYSGCLVCNRLPFHIHIDYDGQNRPVRFRVGHLPGKNVTNNEYRFAYDNKGNIVQIKFLTYGKLKEQIDKM